MNHSKLHGRCFSWVCLALALALPTRAGAAQSFAEKIDAVQPKVVKIYGAGGFQRLEAYQSGFLISADGYVLTTWSYVLDTDYITVTLNDGRKFQGELKGYDPRVEIALLKIDAENLPHFNLEEAIELDAGDRVLAFSNLYGVATGNEAVSVLHGSVSVKTNLAARAKSLETPYKGPAYILDAMTNNPGAAGGALTNRSGQLAGILGKELRNSQMNTWLNYSIPVSELTSSIDSIMAGRLIPRVPDIEKPATPLTLAKLGIVLVPDVLSKTPPFVDKVRRGSPADKAGIRADDFLLFVNEQIISSCKTLKSTFSFIDRDDRVRLTIQRGQELLDFELGASD